MERFRCLNLVEASEDRRVHRRYVVFTKLPKKVWCGAQRMVIGQTNVPSAFGNQRLSIDAIVATSSAMPFVRVEGSSSDTTTSSVVTNS